MNFTHLHTHSHYSLLDASATIDGLLQKAQQMGMHALALTDHGNLFGLMEFYKKAPKYNIKAILGCELYISTDAHTKKSRKQGEKHYHHLIVLAKNAQGYKNLIQLASIGYLEGFYYRPRVDKQTLKEHAEGLIGMSACLSGEIPSTILNNDPQKTLSLISEFQECFGRDNFFLEIQNHGIDRQQTVNAQMHTLSNTLNIPLVATNDVHYIHKQDAQAHDALLCIASQNKLSDEKRKRYHGQEFYLKSYQEMQEVFPQHTEALHNTTHVANQCNVELTFDLQLPHIDTDKGLSTEDTLKSQAYTGIHERHPTLTQEIQQRLEYELNTICTMGFASYFLIVADFIRYARSEGIAVGPGRGSVAGSLVAYALGITNIDPLKHSLLFERFLNPERISMPDIDTDFQDDKRDQVIQYVIQKYGQERVANIITFGKLKARAVIRDVGRILNIALPEVDKIAKCIPAGPKATLQTTYDQVSEFQELIRSKPEYTHLFELSLKLEGINRNASTHAAGIIIGKDKLAERIPLYSDPKTKQISTQYEGLQLEHCGLLKMDFLGLRNLTIIQRCLKLLESRGTQLNINDIPLNDPHTYKLLQEGYSQGIFQLESSGMQELMKELLPQTFEEIVALIALYRPGPLSSGMAEEFVKRKHNPQRIKYPHPLLESILKETYGVIVYQEQVMEIARRIAAFSMTEADELRKAMGKKLVATMNKLKEAFVQGAKQNGIDTKLATQLYDQMAKFGEYGFNKSHSVAYAMITYQTAYLKATHPLEYMTALLSCEKEHTEKLVECLVEAKRMNIKILGPSVNTSHVDFSIEGDGIRFGLSAIKNIGEQSMKLLIHTRNTHKCFRSIHEMCEVLDAKAMNRKTLESLIKGGACDEFGENRATHYANIDRILERASTHKKEHASTQISLFEQAPKNPLELEKHPEWDTNTKLRYEKDSLGFYYSGHPLDAFSAQLSQQNIHFRRQSLEHIKIHNSISVCGLVYEWEQKVSRKGEAWGTAYLDLLDGQCTAHFFQEAYQNAHQRIQKNQVYTIQGKLKSKEARIELIGEAVHTPTNSPKTKLHIWLHIPKDKSKDALDSLKGVFLRHKGNTPIILHCTDDKETLIEVGPKYFIQTSPQCTQDIQNIHYTQHIEERS